jgi:hypothetical protein
MSAEPSGVSTPPPAAAGEAESGLRNPSAAARGVAAVALLSEGVVMLLAIQPIRVLGGHLSGAAITVVIALAVLCFLLCGLLGRPWAWHVGTAVQVVLLVSGFIFNGALAVLGVVFGLLWLYVLNVRRTVSRRPVRTN